MLFDSQGLLQAVFAIVPFWLQLRNAIFFFYVSYVYTYAS